MQVTARRSRTLLWALPPLCAGVLLFQAQVLRHEQHTDQPLLYNSAHATEATGHVRSFMCKDKDSLQDVADLPKNSTIVFGDGEMGPAMLYEYGSRMPPAMALGVIDDAQLTRRVGLWAGQGFRQLGIDAVFAPCADVFETSAPSPLGWHCFGSDEQKVATHAQAFADGLRQAGVFPVIKHYPGLGCSDQDTQDALARTTMTRQQVLERHSRPFDFLRNNSSNYGVLVGHVAALDDPKFTPASASPFWIGQLRQKMGFDGLIVSDSAFNKSIQDLPGGESKYYVDALRAGADLIYRPASIEQDRQTLLFASQTGGLPEQRLQEALQRQSQLLDAVKKLRANAQALPPEEWLQEGRELATSLTRSCVAEFGRGDDACQTWPAFEELRLAITGKAPLDARPFLTRLALPMTKSIQAFDASQDTITTASQWCIIHWSPGNGKQIAQPWTPEQLQWFEQAQNRGAHVAVIVLGNPLAATCLNSNTAVKGIVLWSRSPVHLGLAAQWLQGQFHPTAKWPMRHEQMR